MKKLILSLFAISMLIVFHACSGVTAIDEPQKPKNVILLIGDGMGLSQVSAAMTVNGGHLKMADCTVFGYSKTHSASHYITDSGAGGTAISTGKRTYNGAIGVGMDSLPLKTLLEYAEENGLATGLISTSAITHATPASFISHQKSRNWYEAIAADFLKTDVDIVIGGGKDFFSNRSDSVNLIDQLKENGYTFADRLEDIDSTTVEKFYVLSAGGHNPRYSEGRGDLFPEATELACQVLNKNKKGFFLMAEGSMIDWGGHANDLDYIVEETLDFDRAVGKALDFAKKDGETLVLITADHETSGLGINGGDLAAKKVTGGFTTSGHTGTMVPVFAYGPGAEKFSGVQKNTDLYYKMMDLLSLND